MFHERMCYIIITPGGSELFSAVEENAAYEGRRVGVKRECERRNRSGDDEVGNLAGGYRAVVGRLLRKRFKDIIARIISLLAISF